MARRIVAVGGHSGLGLATFQHLFRTSDSFGHAVHLILLVRDTSADHALTALNNLAALALSYDQARADTASSSRVELRSLDLADVRSVRSAAARLLHEDSRIDTLWLNAAVAKSARELISDNSEPATEGEGADTYEHTALVNHAAPLLLLDLLMPLLLDRPSANGNKSRIVFTGSALHRNLNRERDPDEVLCADFQSSALPNRAENEHASSQSGVGSPPWSLRTSYAHSKFLQALGVRKFIRLLEQALQARALQPGSSHIHARSWNEMEVVLVQPGFIPTTGLSREATLPTRILTSYLLPIMPGTSSFVSTLEEGAEVLAAALSWPLQQAHTHDGQPQHGFEIESAQERLIPAPGWVGSPSQASDEPSLTKALVAKGKVLQRPDERTDNVDLQDRWWPSRLCRTEWVHAPEQGSSRVDDRENKHGEGSSGGDAKDESDGGNEKGNFGDDSSRPHSSPFSPAGSSTSTSTHQADRSSHAPPSDSTLALSPSSIASSSSTNEGTSRGDRTPTRSSGSRRSRRLTVSEAATALHGLALSGSFLGEMPEMSSHFLSVDDCGPVRNSEGTLDGKEQAEGSSPRPDLIVDTTPSTEVQDAQMMTVPTTPVKQQSESFQQSSPGLMSAASLPCRTPPRRQASSPLSLYSTSADMLSVRRASASALQPMAQPPQRVHASALMIGGCGGGGVHLMEESVENFVDDQDGFRDSVAGSPSRVRMHGMGLGGSGGRYGSLSSSSSLSARRPSGPASTMWTGGYGMSSSSSPVPVPVSVPSPYYGWRSTSLGNGGSPAPGGGAGGMAFSPSTASYTRSPPFPSRPPSFSQSHTRSASLSLIGSYDESLLSGRMSTMPSQPFEFDAELGVLEMGEGACPRKLRCPKHLSVGFQARYYPLGGADGEVSFSSSSSSSSSSSPSPSPSWSPSVCPSPLPKSKVVPRMEKSTVGSPYVGSIDLEAFFFKRLGEVLDTVRPLTPATVVADSKLATHLSPAPAEIKLSPTEALAQVPAFPGYQVPPKGQIQLIVKNQNLTAVKVFLVKYDLSDMQPGTKTFVRQKSFVSADVSGDRSLFVGNGATTMGRGRWKSNGGEREKEKEKETMRYAVHLQFACPPVVSGGAADSKAQGPGQGRGTEYTIASARDAPMPVPVPVPAATAAEEPTTRRKTPLPKIYLHRNIRVVFAATGLDSFERLDVVMETPVGHVVVVGGGSSSSSIETDGLEDRRRTGLVYSEYAGPSEGWRRARRAVRKKLVGMKEAEVEEVERRRRVMEVAAAQAEAEAEAARLEEEEEESRRAWGEVDTYGREEEEGAALESSVHSAFGIPMPRRTKSRAGSKRSSRAGFGGSEESDHLQPHQLQQMISSSSSSFGPSYPVLSGDVGRMADTRTPSPPPPPPPPALHKN
ncbi:unnamed protein product [Tilletia controversa]|uniref:Atos-like conserved domain-containing protein n=1 Tax=Tilletia caries TaxID=13290 RepID=A0ABN7J4U3_9BASI|nr:unnamed protein product [Tilletia caries]CAD6957251.1 unnamed protein product [Tilletia controversa]CAD7064299.1 unnamed protein product [Tilletia caries]